MEGCAGGDPIQNERRTTDLSTAITILRLDSLGAHAYQATAGRHDDVLHPNILVFASASIDGAWT